jgi:alkylation response protein AidB-like acyl-CoA dehydrogenase
MQQRLRARWSISVLIVPAAKLPCSLLTEFHTIFEGTSEIQQLVIARAISGLRVE